MNRRNNKKGFTIVELVIVIAVIAILAGVLIPTFSGIVTKANESKQDQQAKNAFTEYLASLEPANWPEEGDLFLYGNEVYTVTGATINIDTEVTYVDQDVVNPPVVTPPASGEQTGEESGEESEEG